MKKLVILAALLFCGALGWIAATYTIATQAEQNYFSFLRKYRQWGPVTLTGAGYQRGFLSSRAETVAQTAVGEDKPLRLHFVHTLRHGPLPA